MLLQLRFDGQSTLQGVRVARSRRSTPCSPTRAWPVLKTTPPGLRFVRTMWWVVVWGMARVVVWVMASVVVWGMARVVVWGGWLGWWCGVG